MHRNGRDDERQQWDRREDEVYSEDEGSSPDSLYGVRYGCNVNTNSETSDDDDRDRDPLLDEHNKYGGSKRDNLTKKEDRTRNLLTAVVMTGFVFMAYAVHLDTYSQWLYVRFQEEVLGSNFSKLNISVTKDPCLKGNGSTNKFSKELDEAQSLASTFISYTTLLSLIPAIAINILFGAYADHIGRKIFFIVPITGLLVQYSMAWAVCFWELDMYLLFIGFAISGFTGSYGTLYMALYTYTADNTDKTKSRSFGMVLAGAVSSGLYALSHMCTGYAIANIGYMWPFAMSSLLVLTGLIGIIIFLRETLHREQDAACLPLFEAVKTIFSFHFKKSPNPQHKRMDFLILDLVFILYVISRGPSVQTLFLLDEPFCWNSKTIGTMETIVGVVQSCVMVSVLKLLQRFMSDEWVCFISLMSGFSYKLVFSFAQSSFVIYIGLAISLMQVTVLYLVRGIMSKMVPANKQGALLSSLAVIEVSISAASGAGLNIVYSKSVSFWKGLVYFIVGICIGIGAIVMVIFIFIKKRQNVSK